MIRLEKVTIKDRELLWNINQKYLHEMTNFNHDPMDENGNYHYGYFDEYFKDPKRIAYLIYNDEIVVGFAFICPYSNINENPDYTLAEFTIFPSFRRNHFALDTMRLIFNKHPGLWEIKFNENNIPAKSLWMTISAPFCPKVTHLNEVETVLSFKVL